MGTRERFDEILKRDRFLFIAEISNNHLGDFDRYKKLVLEAKSAGAHAVKIQTFSADSLCLEVSRSRHMITCGAMEGINLLGSIYKSLEVPLEWSLRIRDFADQHNIPLFSSPFSPKDLLFLHDNGFDFFKIASAEMHSPELFLKLLIPIPLFLPLGFASDIELKWISDYLSLNNCRHLMWGLLNCISNYPCSVTDLDINKFFIAKQYVDNVGLSDHSIDSSNIILSYALGARVFEKHLTLSRDDGGPDCSFSLEPSEMAKQIRSINELSSNPMIHNLSLSTSSDLSSAKPSLNFSRSVYAKSSIAKGDLFDS